MSRYLVKDHFRQDTEVQGSGSDRQIRSHGPTSDPFHGNLPGPLYPFSSYIISLTIEKRRWLLLCGHCKFSVKFCHFWSTKYVMDDTETTRMIMLMITCKLFISRFNENVKNLHSQAYDTLGIWLYLSGPRSSNHWKSRLSEVQFLNLRDQEKNII